MKKIIIFNWKMNPSSLREAKRLFSETQKYADSKRINAEIIIAPPFVYLANLTASAFAKSYGGLRFASQDVFWENQGAYTGEISAKMLKDLGVEYVIIGHSERRKYLNETDEMINKKVLAALKVGLKVVLCVGEDLSIRKRGLKAVKNFVGNQLQKDLKSVYNLKPKTQNLIIAYEPIWAISTSGTGKICRPEDVLEMIKFIKNILNSKFKIQNSKLLYGGSVDSKNIASFLKYKEINGALVGGASLKKEEFKEIVKICGKSPKRI